MVTWWSHDSAHGTLCLNFALCLFHYSATIHRCISIIYLLGTPVGMRAQTRKKKKSKFFFLFLLICMHLQFSSVHASSEEVRMTSCSLLDYNSRYLENERVFLPQKWIKAKLEKAAEIKPSFQMVPRYSQYFLLFCKKNLQGRNFWIYKDKYQLDRLIKFITKIKKIT